MMVPGPSGAVTKIYLSKQTNRKANQQLLSKTMNSSIELKPLKKFLV